jgi:hypothetical protein
MILGFWWSQQMSFKMQRRTWLSVVVTLNLVLIGAANETQSGGTVVPVEELFRKCVSDTGVNYLKVKAQLMARPQETAVLTKKTLGNADAPWQDRVTAQALAEEMADPPAYSRARHDLLRLGYLGVVLFGAEAPRPIVIRPDRRAFEDAIGLSVSDPVMAAESSEAGKVFRLMEKYPGLTGETLLKTTGESILPKVAEIAVEWNHEDKDKYHKSSATKRADVTLDPPLPLTEEEFLRKHGPRESGEIVAWVKSAAALTTTYANSKDTANLLGTLDATDYQDVLARCRSSLDKRKTTSQPAHTQK